MTWIINPKVYENVTVNLSFWSENIKKDRCRGICLMKDYPIYHFFLINLSLKPFIERTSHSDTLIVGPGECAVDLRPLHLHAQILLREVYSIQYGNKRTSLTAPGTSQLSDVIHILGIELKSNLK